MMCSQARYYCSRKNCNSFAWQTNAVACPMAQMTGFLCRSDQWVIESIKDTNPYSLCVTCERMREQGRVEQWKKEKKKKEKERNN